MESGLLRRCASEAVGTAALVGIGTGAIVAAARDGGVGQSVLALAWFLAVTIPVFAFASTSGAHLNPAVTVALTLRREFRPREVPAYVSAQVAGAFAGSSVVLATLGDHADLGATLPAPGELLWALVGEAAFTALLVLAVLYLADRGVGRWRWRLLLPGAAVGLSTYVIGPLSGSSLNPARTIAPAVLSNSYTGTWEYVLVVGLAAATAALAWNRWAPTRSGEDGNATPRGYFEEPQPPR